jgi:hypothetical protein
MTRFRNAAVGENFGSGSRRALGPIAVAPAPVPVVRRRLSPENAKGLEILGHAIEYLADEYAADPTNKGPLGNADPRVQAIQTLKSLNRALYFSGVEVPPVWQRVRRWLMGESVSKVGSGNRS